MEFINNNLTLIIIISVIIVMTLIGYIADKSNFVEKRKEKEKNKKEQVDNEKKNRKTKEQQQFDAEIGDGKDLIMDEGSVDFPVELDREPWEINIPAEKTEESIEGSEETLSDDSINFDVPAENSNNNENNVDDFNNEESIKAPLNNDVLNLDQYDNSLKEENKQYVEVKNDVNIENEMVNEEQNNDERSEEAKKDDNLPLPEIDSLKEVDDEDIWKF